MRDNAPAHLRHAISEGGSDHPDEEPGLPALRENEFRPYARPTHKALYAIHFISPSGDIRSFQYVHLDSDTSFTPQCISLRFMGVKVMDVLIEGRNLWELYDYIHQHRTAWVRAAARDFAQDGEAIVTKISVVEAADPAAS